MNTDYSLLVDKIKHFVKDNGYNYTDNTEEFLKSLFDKNSLRVIEWFEENFSDDVYQNAKLFDEEYLNTKDEYEQIIKDINEYDSQFNYSVIAKYEEGVATHKKFLDYDDAKKFAIERQDLADNGKLGFMAGFEVFQVKDLKTKEIVFDVHKGEVMKVEDMKNMLLKGGDNSSKIDINTNLMNEINEFVGKEKIVELVGSNWVDSYIKVYDKCIDVYDYLLNNQNEGEFKSKNNDLTKRLYNRIKECEKNFDKSKGIDR